MRVQTSEPDLTPLDSAKKVFDVEGGASESSSVSGGTLSNVESVTEDCKVVCLRVHHMCDGTISIKSVQDLLAACEVERPVHTVGQGESQDRRPYFSATRQNRGLQLGKTRPFRCWS